MWYKYTLYTIIRGPKLKQWKDDTHYLHCILNIPSLVLYKYVAQNVLIRAADHKSIITSHCLLLTGKLPNTMSTFMFAQNLKLKTFLLCNVFFNVWGLCSQEEHRSKQTEGQLPPAGTLESCLKNVSRGINLDLETRCVFGLKSDS